MQGGASQELPGWLMGSFRGSCATLAGEIRLGWHISPRGLSFFYWEEGAPQEDQLYLSRVAGRLGVEELGEDYAVIELVRGRERARLLVRRLEGGVELFPLASQRGQLLILPLAGRLRLSRR